MKVMEDFSFIEEDAPVKILISYWGTRYFPGVEFYLYECTSMEILQLYLHTGIVKGECKDLEQSQVSHNISEECLFVSVGNEYMGILVRAHSGRVNVNGLVVPNTPNDVFLNTRDGRILNCYCGETDWKFSKLPVVSDSDCEQFLSSIQEYLTPFVEANFKANKNHLGGFSFNLRTLKDMKDIYPRVKSAYSLRLNTSVISKNYATVDRVAFSVEVSVYNTEYRTFVDLPSVYLPQHLRGVGIYSGLVKIIKDFMVKYYLGDSIGLIDSSEDGATSRVAERFGIYSIGSLEYRYGIRKD